MGGVDMQERTTILKTAILKTFQKKIHCDFGKILKTLCVKDPKADLKSEGYQYFTKNVYFTVNYGYCFPCGEMNKVF